MHKYNKINSLLSLNLYIYLCSYTYNKYIKLSIKN